MNAFPTSRLACPTLGPGPSEVVATGKQVNAPGLASTIQRSPLTVLPFIRPPIRYIEPSLLDTAFTAAPYRGNGFVCWTVKLRGRMTQGYGEEFMVGDSDERNGACGAGDRWARSYGTMSAGLQCQSNFLHWPYRLQSSVLRAISNVLVPHNLLLRTWRYCANRVLDRLRCPLLLLRRSPTCA